MKDKALDGYTSELLKQITMLKVQKDEWKIYKKEWLFFKKKDHLEA